LDGIVDGKVRGKDGALVGSVADASETIHDDLPLCPADAFVGGEYDSVEQVAGKKVAYLRRMQAWSTGSEITYGMGQRVDTLEMRWLGNAQMKPTLVGYIEGAPPVPSENLTVEADYRGASSVEFKVSESAARTYEQTLSTGVDMKLGVEVGAATNTGGGVAFGLNAFEEANTKALVQGHLDASARFQSDFSHGDVRASTTSDKLSLTGAREKKAEYPRLGLRYEPKNVGYATVVSTLADVYALRLKSSKRMVSYRVVPVKDIPPDINTVTFLINPAYTKNGTLDGQVGSESATGDVFSHVAKARAQYGSAVESSYFRVREAYSLRDEIERSNRNNEARVINKKTGLIGQSKQDATVSTENSSGEKQQQQVASKA
ncbi:MAG: hypothetical protein ACPG77_18935, partial [Nannocystaceae bacterium]